MTLPATAGYQELIRRCTTGSGMVIPDRTQHLGVVAELIRSLAADPGPAATTIVLGTDALDWATAAQTLEPDRLVPLTSTCPSTSVAAWITAVSGLHLAAHGVPGPVYRHPGVPEGRLWNIFRERHYGWDDDWTTGGVPTEGIVLGDWSTVFARLAEASVATRVHLGDISTMPGAWADALVRGAGDVISPTADWDRIRMDPAAIADATVEEVESSLADLRGAPAVIWIHVNLDEYIHRRGYDRALKNAVRRLGAAAADWADGGRALLLHSDHGQVRNRCPARLDAAWRKVETPAFCSGPAGGAGRIRWLHPLPGKARAVREILQEAEGEGVVVAYRDELDLFPSTSSMRSAIGDVVVIATGGDFPIPDPEYVYEHGGLTPEEMIAPLAIWHAR